MLGDPGSVRADDLRRWRAQFEEIQPIGELPPRQRSRCVGAVTKLRLDPGRSLSVTVEDGSGELTAVFSGRVSLPGVELGDGLLLEGTLAVNRAGVRTMRNPEWRPVAGPYA